jgi:hypothetical protein
LGATCKFIKANEGSRNLTCYNAAPNDVTKPIIKWDSSAFNVMHMGSDKTNKANPKPEGTGYNIGEVDSFSTITFGITTNELSQCKASTELKNTYKEMTLPFSDTYYDGKHNYTLYGLAPNKEFKYYIICVDPNGNPQSKTSPFVIKFKTSDGPDLQPPRIVSALPVSGGQVPFNATSKQVTLFVDEVSPFKCKADTADLGYDLMKKELACSAKSMSSTVPGYGQCQLNLNITSATSGLYIRCRDAPKNAKKGQGNEMQSGFKYTISRSKELKMPSFCVTGAGKQDCSGGTNFFAKNLTLVVSTKDGSDKGNAICTYEDITYGFPQTEFFQTNSSSHVQVLTFFVKRAHTYEARCTDSAGNVVSKQLNFTVDIDTYAPTLEAIYKTKSGIGVALSEAGTCEYANSTFVYGSGTTTAKDTKTHSIPLGSKSYYVICQDKIGNKMSAITIYP